MDLSTSFLVYATLFRLAVIAAGALIIVLGYRLFLQGLASGDQTDASLEGGGFKLALKNAAPGTSFALFGAVLISVMVIQGSPELDITSTAPGSAAVPVELQQSAGSLRLRGDGSGAVVPPAQPEVGDQLPALAASASEQLLQAGIQRELQEDFSGALEAYLLALSMPGLPLPHLASPLNQMAWVYHQQAEPDLALPLALLAHQINPTSIVVMDTLARVYVQLEQFDKAQALLNRVLQIDPDNSDAKAIARLINQKKAR
ncbi:tetratricopeptide repeat protein [Marinobacter sp.]|uniref:tetratricopeptide repeat protein n=1 Tax=Marinobacter sp. TaxID=50741 RepID=UPI00384E20A9